jgi:hypothetical protein
VWYTGESREKTLTYIDTLLDKTFSWWIDVYHYLKKETHSGCRMSLIIAVRDVQIQLLRIQESIINLKGVYDGDEDFKASVDSKINDLKERYEKTNATYPIETTVVYTPPQPSLPLASLSAATPKLKPAPAKPTVSVDVSTIGMDNISTDEPEEPENY